MDRRLWFHRLASGALLSLALPACTINGDGRPALPAHGPGTPFDLQAFIDRQVQEGAVRVVVPPGRYRVTPRDRQHLVLRNLHDVEIVADGVELVCTETTRALTIEHCRNLRVSGLTIDYDPLPFTQGRIVELAPDRSWLDFQIIDGYPDAKLEERIEIYDPVAATLRRETMGGAVIQSLGGRRYRVDKGPGYRQQAGRDTEQVGDILVTNHAFAPGGSAAHAVVISDSAQVVLEDVDLFASNCFGFLEEGCEGTTYLRCRIDRRAPASDFPKRAFPRMRSLNADAFHSSDAVRGPAILACTARSQGDDCVNIRGAYHLVVASSGAVLRVLAKYRMNIEPGDPVAFLDYSGNRPADAQALDVAPDGQITAEEKDFLARQRMDERLRTNAGDGLARAFRLTLDRPVPLARGALVCSQKRAGSGFRVEDCEFGMNRSRGILIKGSQGRVAGNRITGAWMAGILVSPEFWWLEAGCSDDLVIANNTVEGCKGIGIDVAAAGGDGQVAPSGAHNRIEVSGNIVARGGPTAIRVTSTADLRVVGNVLAGSGMVVTNCENPLVEHNR